MTNEKMIEHYHIVRGLLAPPGYKDSPPVLHEGVEELLARGWSLYGNPFPIASDGGQAVWGGQAMVK